MVPCISFSLTEPPKSVDSQWWKWKLFTLMALLLNHLSLPILHKTTGTPILLISYYILNLLPYFWHAVTWTQYLTFILVFFSVGKWLLLMFTMYNDDCNKSEAPIFCSNLLIHTPLPFHLGTSKGWKSAFIFSVVTLLPTSLHTSDCSHNPSRNLSRV